jgi:hypothetical protein
VQAQIDFDFNNAINLAEHAVHLARTTILNGIM